MVDAHSSLYTSCTSQGLLVLARVFALLCFSLSFYSEPSLSPVAPPSLLDQFLRPLPFPASRPVLLHILAFLSPTPVKPPSPPCLIIALPHTPMLMLVCPRLIPRQDVTAANPWLAIRDREIDMFRLTCVSHASEGRADEAVRKCSVADELTRRPSSPGATNPHRPNTSTSPTSSQTAMGYVHRLRPTYLQSLTSSRLWSRSPEPTEDRSLSVRPSPCLLPRRLS